MSKCDYLKFYMDINVAVMVCTKVNYSRTSMAQTPLEP